MHRRLFLPIFPIIYSSISLANDAAWNCEQSKDNKEWVCSGDNKPANTQAAPTEEPVSKAQAEPKAAESQEIKPEPELAEPAVTTPLPATPAVASKPVPAPIPEASTETAPATLAEPQQQEAPKEPEAQQAEAPEAEESAKPEPVKPAPTPASAAQGHKAGWLCGASDKSEGWNCNLTGADPKGQARAITDEVSSFRIITPTFDHKQEQTFNTLVSQLPYDPWQNCGMEGKQKPVFVPRKQLRESTPIDVKSDYSEVFDNEVSSYFGNVEMNRADQHSISNIANYDTVSETLGLQGSVYYSEDELALYGESAVLKLAEDQAKIRDVLFISPGLPLRGKASAVYRDNKVLSRYRDVSYTSCKPGNQDWMVHATELKMNKETGKGSAKNAWLEFKGTPVFYSPYLSFPVDDRRLSGFLAPSFGNTQRNGFNLSVPYYWNIAPNFDATLRPRYLSKRGFILAGDFRYLTEYATGKLGTEYLPEDDSKDSSGYGQDQNPHYKEARYMVTANNFSRFTPNITSSIDINKVSDKDYFNDLGSALSRPYNSFLRTSGDIGYRSDSISLVGRAESYQSVDRALGGAAIPYKRLPQVNLDLNHSFKFMPLNTGVENEYVFFDHNYRVTGQRFNTKPTISFPLQTASAFLTPKLSLLHTEYVLGNQDPGSGRNYYFDSNNTYSIRSRDSISRTLPILSADAGVYIEGDMNIGSSHFLHTIEPRLFYLYVPKVNQDNIPVFDTALNDFNFDSMFRDNRFSGIDRWGDANQITAALTSRLLDDKGREKVKLSIGQIFYLSDRDVDLPQLIPVYGSTGCTPPETTCAQHYTYNGRRLVRVTQRYFPQTNSLSNTVADLTSQITDHIALDTGLQWNPDRSELARGQATLHYTGKPGELINVGYRYRKNTLIPDKYNKDLGRPNDIIQTDVSFHWPIYDNWSAVGRWQYSLLYNSTQDGFFGVEKENCCWRFRIIGRRWVNNIAYLSNTYTPTAPTSYSTAQGESQTGIFFQVELKGLTGIGEKLDDFFEKQIYGYQKPIKD